MVQFGVCVAQDGMQFQELEKMILEAEEIGFDSFWLFDHLSGFPFPERHAFLECWTALSALASSTKKIRIGPLVANIQNRSPSLAAKMAANVDVISGGRLELGLGAGGAGRSSWHKKLNYIPEYAAYGTDFSERIAARIQKLDEGVQIIKLLWSQDHVSFSGKYYAIQNATCSPKPVQKPHPRIWIGGTGEELLLRVAAKHSNATNFAWDLTPEDFRHKIAVLKKQSENIGRDSSEILKSLLTGVLIANRENEFDKLKKRLLNRYDRLNGYLPYALRTSGLAGTPEQCVRRLSEFVEAGVDYFILLFEDHDQMRLFGNTVLPQFISS